MESITPIFIFSLPRSGSTLLQRILAAHEQIATAAEPWLLLPLLYARRRNGVYAEYNQQRAVDAFWDFCEILPDGSNDYDSAVRSFALRLYRQAGGEQATHFVDKTPRYSLVADQVMETFPEAKFIFLWRNPLAIASSMMQSWGRKGRWSIDRHKIDLYKGLANLTITYQHFNRGFALKYEDLVAHPKERVADICTYLGLPFDPAVLTNFNQVELSGRMSDPAGRKRYHHIASSTTEKWKSTFGNPLRQHWANRYLRWIGEERLTIMGYDLWELIEELETTPSNMNYLLSDLLRNGRGMLRPWIEPSMQRSKFKKIPVWTQIVEHR